MKKVYDKDMQDMFESVIMSDEVDNDDKAGAIVVILKTLQDASGLKLVQHNNAKDPAFEEVF